MKVSTSHAGQELEKLKHFFERYKHRSARTESDCSIVENVWLVYRDSKEEKVHATAFEWFIARIEDKKTNDLARTIICWRLYHRRKTLTKKERKHFREALRHLPRKRRKLLKQLAR